MAITLNAHEGRVLDVDVDPASGLAATVGETLVRLNRFDASSPRRPSPDPCVRLFDLRSSRTLRAVQSGVPAPTHLRWVVRPDVAAAAGAALMVVGSAGGARFLGVEGYEVAPPVHVR